MQEKGRKLGHLTVPLFVEIECGMKPDRTGAKALLQNNFSKKFSAGLNGQRAKLGRTPVALNQS